MKKNNIIPLRDYETALHQHYDLEGYWVEGESDSALFRWSQASS